MPAPSEWAKSLATDLKAVGEILGFISEVEVPPSEESTLSIDVVWKMMIKEIKKEGSPLPNELVIVSIEIQYSNSPASISHGLIKGQYAGSPYHIVVSYHKLTNDFKQALKIVKPVGLEIIDGDGFANLRLWIQYVLTQEKDLADRGKKALEELASVVKTGSVDVTEQIRETMKKEVELMFAPKRITELLGTLAIDDTRNALAIENAMKSTFHSIQSWLSKYAISTCVTISGGYLFNKPIVVSGGYDYRTCFFYIYADRVELFANGYTYEFQINGRNVKAIHKSNNYSFYESIPTERVKKFIVAAIEHATEFLKQFNVTREDLTELDQITEVLNDTTDKLTEGSSK
jgi:hypothetical protein